MKKSNSNTLRSVHPDWANVVFSKSFQNGSMERFWNKKLGQRMNLSWRKLPGVASEMFRCLTKSHNIEADDKFNDEGSLVNSNLYDVFLMSRWAFLELTDTLWPSKRKSQQPSTRNISFRPTSHWPNNIFANSRCNVRGKQKRKLTNWWDMTKCCATQTVIL